MQKEGFVVDMGDLYLRDHEDQLPHMLAGPYHVKVTQNFY